jgi:hypothetical protein
MFAASVPFSIALAQTLLTITAALTIRHQFVTGARWPRTPFDRPILAFLAAAVLAALIGLDPVKSLWGARTYVQVILIYLVVVHVRTSEHARSLLQWFLSGMVLTSAHTVINAVGPWDLSDPFPGSMTESGQLLFTLGFSAALWMHTALWPRVIGKTTLLHALALVLNLKRGVWLGAVATLTLLGALRSRRLLVVTAVGIIVVIVAMPTVRTRLETVTRDFFLPGQRYDIWTAAIDVIQRFPMGIGRKSGTILRDYPNVSARHKHAHNNVLQITMELGVLGLAAYAWWMIVWARLVLRVHSGTPHGHPVREAIALAALATCLGCHIAGLVEYHFGDTEVLLVLFLTMGLTLAVDRMNRTEGKTVPPPGQESFSEA